MDVCTGDAGVAALADAIRDNPRCKIEDFRLSTTSMGDPGALSLHRMLNFNTSIMRLTLSENKISDQVMTLLNENVKRKFKMFQCVAKNKEYLARMYAMLEQISQFNVQDYTILTKQHFLQHLHLVEGALSVFHVMLACSHLCRFCAQKLFGYMKLTMPEEKTSTLYPNRR